MKTERQKLVKKLDDKVRELINYRDRGCQVCFIAGCPMEVSHVIPRSNKALRWDLNNLKLLCTKCHKKWHESPESSDIWFKVNFPNRHFYLSEKMKEPARPIGIQELKDKLTDLENTELMPF